jgi:hypothetical protein
VALGLGDEGATVHHVDRVLALSTYRERNGERIAGSPVLGSRAGVVLARS